MSYRFHFFLSFFLGFQDPTSNFYIMFRLGGMAMTVVHWAWGAWVVRHFKDPTAAAATKAR